MSGLEIRQLNEELDDRRLRRVEPKKLVMGVRDWLRYRRFLRDRGEVDYPPMFNGVPVEWASGVEHKGWRWE